MEATPAPGPPGRRTRFESSLSRSAEAALELFKGRGSTRKERALPVKDFEAPAAGLEEEPQQRHPTTERLHKALHEWSAQYQIPTESSTGNPCAERHGRETDAVGAVEHETGCGQMKVGDKSNEIPAARKLLRSMQLSGRIVTADAMHTQVETAQLILGRGADYGCQGRYSTKAIDWNGGR